MEGTCPLLGQFFFSPFVFRFLTYLLSCILSLRSGISSITLLCYVLYVNFVIVYYLALILLLVFYGAISVTTFVEVGSFFGCPDHQPCLPQHLVSSFVFIVFSLISFCSRLKVVFCIVIIIFSLFVGIYFYLWLGNSKTFADCERVVFGIGPCPFILPNWPLLVHFAWNWPLPVHPLNCAKGNKSFHMSPVPNALTIKLITTINNTLAFRNISLISKHLSINWIQVPLVNLSHSFVYRFRLARKI